MAIENTQEVEEVSVAALTTKLALLGVEDREAYRLLRAAMWRLVQERSGRSDFPSEMS